ncbi:hypothetical protein ACA910_000494 [Epithemia clementina (nom. ined.)]
MIHTVSLNSDPGDPANMKEATNSGEWPQWKKGLHSEYDNFTKQKAWEQVKRPRGARVLRTKNVYKKKPHAITKEIRYKVRTVVKGYEQIQGVDYTESYALVVADQTVRMMLATSLYMHFRTTEPGPDWVIAKSLDVEATFLNAPLEETVYIEVPEYYGEYCRSRGLPEPTEDTVLKLNMGQYGLVQVARAWVKRFTVFFLDPKGVGLLQCISDPCFFVKRDNNGTIVLMALIYIDNAIYCGLQSETEALLKWIQEHVTITDSGDLDTHLGVDYVLGEDEIGPYFECSMPKYIWGCISEFEEHTGKQLKEYRTPATPGSNVLKNQEEMVNQSGYRKFVGKILFVVKKVLPDCANATRELSMHLENPGIEGWKAMHRLFGYLRAHYRPLKL